MFPDDIVRFFHGMILVLRRLKWLFVTLFYYSIFGAVFVTQDIRFIAIPAPAIALACLAYISDKRRDEQGLDDFKGDRLFFRYGELIYWTVISIPVKEEWSFEATQVSAMTLRTTLAQKIASRLPSSAVHILPKKQVIDFNSLAQKEFTRVRVSTPMGSSVTFFIHYAVFGHTITAHYFVFRRGAFSDWDIVKFVFASPLTIWLWGIPWLRNRFSILSHASNFRSDSFDAIDLETMYKVTYRVVLEETIKLLRAVNLLTPEIEQVIQYHINNSQNVQNVSVNAATVAMGSIQQSSSTTGLKQSA
jgi:hypothetical protein